MIRNQREFDLAPPAKYDGVFLWEFLKPAWGETRIEPSDVDAMIERFGAYLLFETKAPGVPLREGQRIALEGLHHKRDFTIVCCAKTPATIDGFEVWRHGQKTHHTGDAHALVRFCSEWREAQEHDHASRRVRWGNQCSRA